MLKFCQEVDFRGMGHMSRKNVVNVTFLLVFSTIFRYQPIRCSDLIEVLTYFFSPFNRFCQVPAYLLRGSLLNYIISVTFFAGEEPQSSEESKIIVLSAASRPSSRGRKIPFKLLKVKKQAQSQVSFSCSMTQAFNLVVKLARVRCLP